MTEIKTATVRRTRTPFARYGPDQKKIIVVVHPLGADDAISVRLERRREPYTILVSDLYSYLVRQRVLCKQMERVRSRIGKKARRVKRK